MGLKRTLRASLTFLQTLFRDRASRKYLLPWLESFIPPHSPIHDRVPWITFSAFEWLNSHLDSEMKVFEYGSGGSTFYFAQKVKELVSVEHQREWYDFISSIFAQKNLTHSKYLLIEGESNSSMISEPHDYKGFTSAKKKGISYEKYVKSILNYPDRYFDIVLVDGRARPACIYHALPKIKPGGHLILDDSFRERYFPAMELLKNFRRLDFKGLSPYQVTSSQTTIWEI